MIPRRLLFLFGWLFGVGVAGEQAQAASTGRWLSVTAAEFILITELPEKQAVAWAEEFSQFTTALKTFLPVDAQALAPLTIVIFRGRDFLGYRPLGRDGRPQDVSGFFSRRLSWAVAGLGTADTERVRHIIFHEGTHWFMSAFKQRNPVWLEEGIAELYSTFAVDAKNAYIGKVISSHLTVLNAQGPMPMEKLLFLSQSDLYGGGTEGAQRTGIAYAQSWAFLHYLIFGENSATSRKQLIDYLRALGSGTHPDEAFQSAFGATYAQMDVKLRAYVRSGNYFTMKGPLAPARGFKAEPASPREVDLALARLSLAAGRFKEAMVHIDKAGIGADDGPESFVVLGEIFLEMGDRDKARGAFEKAVAKGSRDFRPHYELASAQHRLSILERTALSPEDARKIANGYERAINANPQFRSAYVGLSIVAPNIPAGSTDDRGFLELGLKLFPDDPDLRIGLALLARRDGSLEVAKKYLDEVLNAAKPPPAVTLRAARTYRANLQFDFVVKRVRELEAQKNFREALALVKSSMEESGDTNDQRRYLAVQRNLEFAERNELIRLASDGGNWTEVRRLISEFLEANTATPLQRTQMENRLKELERKGLAS